MPLAEVKSHLSELVGRVANQHERVTVHGRPSAVLVAVDDLEALEETIAVLSDSDTIRQLAASDSELARGEGETQEQLVEAMKRRRPSTRATVSGTTLSCRRRHAVNSLKAYLSQSRSPPTSSSSGLSWTIRTE